MPSNAPRPADLIVTARWVVPVASPGVLTDHAVVVNDGRIEAVLPAVDALAAYAPARRVDLPVHALIPGLVNAHTHTPMTLLRGVADDVPLKTWLTDEIWPRESRHVDPEFVHDGSLLAAAEMLRGGITCCHDMYFHPDATARALVSAGMRGVLGLPVLEFPSRYAADADSYLSQGLAIRDAWRHEPLIGFSLAPHAPYTVGDSTFGKIVMYAEQVGLPIQTHLHETAGELSDSIAQHGCRPLARLARLAVLGPGFSAHHGVYLDAGEIDLLARHGTSVVHCPSSNLKLASGMAPVGALLAAGVNVALGTDGAASNNRLDLFEEMRLAALLAKAVAGDAAVAPAHTVLRMATLDGAQALGLADSIGSLSAGKAADFAAVSFASPELEPCYDPVSHLVYAASRHDVTHVWVAGRAVVENRRPCLIDLDSLGARVRAWQERLR